MGNNLDKKTPDHSQYSKNIGFAAAPDLEEDPDFVDPVKVQQLISQVAAELKMDEEQAVTNLMRDRELHERLRRLKMGHASNSDHQKQSGVNSVVKLLLTYWCIFLFYSFVVDNVKQGSLP